MNIFKRDLIEFLFKALWIPMCIFLYVQIFDIQLGIIRGLLYGAAFITVLNAGLKLQYLRRSFKSSILLLRSKEKKISAAKARIDLTKQAHHNAVDSDDEFEADEESDAVKAEYNRTLNLDDEDDEDKQMNAKRKLKRFKVTWSERKLLYWTRNLYKNDFEATAAVFGVRKAAEQQEQTRSAGNPNADSSAVPTAGDVELRSHAASRTVNF
jgi:hypothetical protein